MRLQGKSILVLPDENPEQTKGGIINPIVKDKPNAGVVMDCGPGCEVCEVGDHIQYKRKGASIINIDGQEQHFIIEEQIYFNHGQ
jgi:co-chaperonin GroES (HSP10)